MNDARYTGRFAPSPSGELHFGSLISALGSYLQARAHHGIWRVRIEDIDPPREVAGAASTILHQLEHYGLHWDGEVLWQSQRHDAYRERLAWLQQQGLCYRCDCSRARIQAIGGIYDGHCRDLPPLNRPGAWRLRQTQPVDHFYDQLRGTQRVSESQAAEDFIIHRRDGLFAYNLAVVTDDHFQGITEVMRGADLISATVRQIALYHHFGWQAPAYLHLPLARDEQGNKLSKQNHAPALATGDPRPDLVRALAFLNQTIVAEWQALTVEQLLASAVANWSVEKIRHSQIMLAEL
ncbi:tRNA glutamyl-Q(34) synthetase GluQRS [Enterobacteriaceae bacterium ESL0689]|nr:tRNA glutamyl-Q(34) synthetase GluQRS [Enterobacteriaceae bacterium ESL0689]